MRFMCLICHTVSPVKNVRKPGAKLLQKCKCVCRRTTELRQTKKIFISFLPEKYDLRNICVRFFFSSAERQVPIERKRWRAYYTYHLSAVGWHAAHQFYLFIYGRLVITQPLLSIRFFFVFFVFFLSVWLGLSLLPLLPMKHTEQCVVLLSGRGQNGFL